ncbi:spermidine/putrescine ABC transporter ATP-binding protein, partial [Halorubrum sp. E3]
MDSERDAEPSRAAPAVELDGVTKRYGETAAVDGVSLRVREGEFLTVVGPSGCGKTTTLRLIAGFEEPTAGTVRFAGDSVAGVPPEDRDVGVVFQSYALFPHMTVGENVAYGLNFADPPEGTTRDERVAELLELV